MQDKCLTPCTISPDPIVYISTIYIIISMEYILYSVHFKDVYVFTNIVQF